MRERFDPAKQLEALNSIPQLPPPPQFDAPLLNPPKQTFAEAFEPVRHKYMKAFYHKHGWLGNNIWEDYAQEGIIKLWDMWQKEPGLFTAHPPSYIIKCGMHVKHLARADQRRDKHIAFSMDDTPEDFLDTENVYVEMVAYRNQTRNPYRAIELRIDFDRAVGQTVESFESHPNREFIYFMFMRILAGYSIHEAKEAIGMKRKTASNYRYEAFRRLKQNFACINP